MLGMATRNVDRLARLIDDLLDFSKLESGKMEIRPQIIDIPPLLKEAVASMDNVVQEPKRRGRLRRKRFDVPAAYADSDRILQVVQQSRFKRDQKSSRQAGGEHQALRARRYEESAIKTMVMVEVEDTGKGILPARTKKRIFNRFTQLESTQKQDIHGTGTRGSVFARR